MKCPHCNQTFEKLAPHIHFQVPVKGWPNKFTSICGVSSTYKSEVATEVDCKACLRQMAKAETKKV